MPKSRLAWFFVLAALLIAGAAPSSASAACSTTFTGATSQDFNTDSNWTNGAPTGSCDAIVSGGTAVLHGGASAASLTVSGGKVQVEGSPSNDAVLSLGGNSTIGAGGSLVLAQTGANPGQAIVSGNTTISNAGSIRTQTGTSGRSIRIGIANSGSVQIGADTTLSGTTSNTGSWSVSAGATLIDTATGQGTDFAQAGGTFANNGTTVQENGVFKHTGGTVSGAPVQICGASLNPTGPGTAAFDFVQIPGVCSGGTLGSDIGTGDTVRLVKNPSVAGALTVGSPSLTNRGTLELAGPGTNEQDQLVGGGTVTNEGTLLFSQGQSPILQKNVINKGTVTVSAGVTATLNGYAYTQQAGTTTVNGSLNAESGFTLAGGTLANPGTTTGFGTLAHTGGSMTGNPIRACGALTLGATGTAAFDFLEVPYVNGLCTGRSITGDIAAEETVRLVARSTDTADGLTVTASADFTNRGTLELGGTGTHAQDQLVGGRTITNEGSFTVTQPRDVSIRAAIVNNGTFRVKASQLGSVSVGLIGAFTEAAGTATVDAGAALDVSGVFTVSGGQFVGTGPTTGEDDLVASGGMVTGQPAKFRQNVSLSGTGTGTFDLFQGAHLNSDVPDGYHLLAEGDLYVRGPAGAGAVNHGIIELIGSTGDPNVYGLPLDNQGTLSSTASAASYRVVNVALTNEGTLDVAADLGVTNAFTSTGTIAIRSGAGLGTQRLTQTAGATTVAASSKLTSIDPVKIDGGTLGGAGTIDGSVVNAGTVSPSPSPATLTITGNYAQSATGFLTAGVRSSGNDRLAVTGTATLGGTLQVTTAAGYVPPKDQAYTVLSAASVTGTFATTAGLASGPYALAYAPGAVTLTAAGRTEPPPAEPTIAIGDATIANPAGGSADATFPITLSAASLTPVTVHYATANGTASAPDGYRSASGVITFAPGQTTATVPVTVFGTGAPGASRTFFVDLSDPQGATLDTARGTGTILGSLSLSTVAPATGGNRGSTELTIVGRGLSDSDHVTLTAAGKPAIAGTDAHASPDGRTLTAVMALKDAPVGARDVTVTSGTGTGAKTLPGAFTVEVSTPAVLAAAVDGPRTTRLDGGWFGQVYLHNSGNTDAVHTLVRVDGLPTGVPASVGGTEGAPVESDDGEEHSITFMVDRVGGNGDVAIPLYFNLDNLKVAHTVVAAPRAKVLLVSNPELVPEQPVTVKSAGRGSDGHFRTTFVEHNSGGSREVSIELYSAPAPEGAELPLLKVDPGETSDTYTIVAPVPQSGCSVPGDPQAKVLQWDCKPANRASLASSHCVGTVLHCQLAALQFSNISGASRGRSAGGAVDVLWEVFHAGHTVKEAKDVAATSLSGEEKERDIVIGCLDHAGFIDRTDRQLLHIASQRELGFEWTKLGTGVLNQTGPIGGITGILAFSALGAAFEHKFDGELARRVLDAALADQSGNIRNPFADIATRVGTRKLTKEEIREVLNRAESECEKALIHEEGPQIWRLPVSALLSNDPNDMTGPPGPGKVHYLDGASNTYHYTATFENLPTAGAPAYAVSVVDKLDTKKLDPATVRLGPVTFGTHTISPPAGLTHFSSEVDLRPARGELVDVTGDVNAQTGVITWRYTTVDPVTHAVVKTTAGGFLPPNKSTPEGEGSVTFDVVPTAAGRRNGAKTANAATIVFDTNAPIDTPVWRNVVDRSRPKGKVRRARAKVRRIKHRGVHTLEVRLGGHDRGSGIGSYDVYAAKGGGRLTRIRHDAVGKRVAIVCRPGARYRFAVLARDRVGNLQRKQATSRKVRCR